MSAVLRPVSGLLILIAGAIGGDPGLTALRAQSPSFEPLLWVYAEDRKIPGVGPAIKALGFNGVNVGGGEDPAFATAAGLAVYVDPALPKGLIHLHESVFEEALRRALSKTPDLRRPVGLDDPLVRSRTQALLARRLKLVRNARPLFVSIGDEISYTRLINPADWCRRESTLSHFRSFLGTRWASNAARLVGWGLTSDPREAPEPVTTTSARHGFFSSPRPPHALVAWNDSRAFADARFADYVGFATETVRKLMPGVPVGFLGSQMPSAFGGFDYGRLLEHVDLIEPYEHGATPPLVTSLDPRVDCYRTVFLSGRPEHAVLQEIDHSFLRGERGVILFSSRELFGGSGTRPTLGGIKGHLEGLRGPGFRAFRDAEPMKPRIAILHSMPSVRLHWMLDSSRDGAAWIWRRTSHETAHSTQARTRQSWVCLLEDLGLEYRFVTPTQVKAGVLESPSLTALVLPRAIALSPGEVEAICAFARRGHLVVADAQTGLFTDRLRERSPGALDELFEIKRVSTEINLAGEQVRRPAVGAVPYPVAEPGVRATGAVVNEEVDGLPVLLSAKSGAGTSLYLNLLTMSYARDRLEAPAKAAWLRTQLQRHLSQAGIRPRVHLVQRGSSQPWPVVARLRETSRGYILAINCNVLTGGCEVPWGRIPPHASRRLKARLWKSFDVQDLQSGQRLGRRRQLDVEVTPTRPALFSLIFEKS